MIEKEEKEKEIEKLKIIKLNLKYEINLIYSIFKSHHFISKFKFKEYLIEIFKSKDIFCFQILKDFISYPFNSHI